MCGQKMLLCSSLLVVLVTLCHAVPGNYLGARNLDRESVRDYDNSFLDLIELNGVTYFISKNQKMSWMEAVSFCLQFGMDIVSIETSAEHAAITAHLINSGLSTTNMWISGNKVGRSTYLWINNEFMIFSNWAPGRPNTPAVNCMYMVNGLWYDLACETNGNFICEAPPAAATEAPTTPMFL